MREVLSFLFDRITDPLGLPIAWYWEWIILAVIELAAFAIAFRAVGDLYDGGMISGSAAGSILHWIIRLIVFVVIWAVTYFVIWLAKLIFAHWILIVSILGGILVAAAIICLIVRYTRKGGENKCVK